MLKKLFLVMVILGLGGGGWWLYNNFQPVFSPLAKKKETTELPLARYDFDHLQKRGGYASEIKIAGDPIDVIKRRKEYKVDYKVSWKSKIIEFESEGKKISGMMNYFDDGSTRPAVIMIRGYADKPGYYSGSGSWKAADKLAQAGWVTVSLDFLGYAGSDKESPDMLQARFEKVNGVLDLIESVKKLAGVNPNKIGIWAHSNGGQIALSTLEVTGGKYPTVLWAPMTNPFPASVLETATSLDDNGQAVVKVINSFQKQYDSRKYAFENYYQWMNGPILIHQGTADQWCKVDWQQSVVDHLKSLGKQAELIVYEDDDHNFSKNWDEVMARDIEFYNKELGK